MKTLIATVVLAGLPLVASADGNVSLGQCAQVAERFSSAPRSLGVGELDQLKTCITLQREAVISDMPQQQAQVAAVSRAPKRVLHDDL